VHALAKSELRAATAGQEELEEQLNFPGSSFHLRVENRIHLLPTDTVDLHKACYIAGHARRKGLRAIDRRAGRQKASLAL
jgi:hypothetical protein